MNTNHEFEIVAEIFMRCTGMMAPGKDDRSMSHTYEEREEAFARWSKENMIIIRAMLNVFEKELAEKDTYIEDPERQLGELEANVLSQGGEL